MCVHTRRAWPNSSSLNLSEAGQREMNFSFVAVGKTPDFPPSSATNFRKASIPPTKTRCNFSHVPEVADIFRPRVPPRSIRKRCRGKLAENFPFCRQLSTPSLQFLSPTRACGVYVRDPLKSFPVSGLCSSLLCEMAKKIGKI